MLLMLLGIQDRLQIGYAVFMNTMQWFHKKAAELDYEEYGQMLEMVDFHYVNDCLGFTELLFQLQQGADAA
jgi:hypothetical protein